jgi:hypothetical protein
MMAAAVALKVAAAAPAAIVNEAGTMSEELLLARVTTEPPVGATPLRVTVHVLTALWLRLIGLQAIEETSTVATRLIVALAELLL